MILYCCQSLDWLRAISINGVLLVASFSQVAVACSDERVIEPAFYHPKRGRLIRLGLCQLNRFGRFTHRSPLPVLHGVTAAVGDFLRSWHGSCSLIKTAFKSLAASAQTWLTTIPDSNAQVIASFSLFFLSRHSDAGASSAPTVGPPAAAGQKNWLILRLFTQLCTHSKGGGASTSRLPLWPCSDDTLRFHLFDNTRGTVIADAELTLNPGNRRFALRHKVDCLIEQRIQLFPAIEAADAFAFAVGGMLSTYCGDRGLQS